MKKKYINPQTTVTKIQYAEPLLAFSDNNKKGESLENGGEGEGTPDEDDIYWGNARGFSIDWDDEY